MGINTRAVVRIWWLVLTLPVKKLEDKGDGIQLMNPNFYRALDLKVLGILKGKKILKLKTNLDREKEFTTQVSDMILNGCSVPIGCAFLNSETSSSAASTYLPRLHAKAALSCMKNSQRSYPESKIRFCRGLPPLHLSSASTPLLSGDLGSFMHVIPLLPRRSSSHMTPHASKDVPYSFRFPPMTKKPRWWWRTLACLPYLMPLHETWMYAKTAYNLHNFLEQLEFATYPFLRAVGRLPSWSLMAYFFIAYLGVVRRKEWPHFFRFHVVMGMLLEISLQVIGTVSRWMPRGIYRGKLGMHFWTAVAFGFLFTVLECIRCALAGMYADVPFACDAAYIQIPYD